MFVYPTDHNRSLMHTTSVSKSLSGKSKKKVEITSSSVIFDDFQ